MPTIERPLPRCFYARDPRLVAPDLLGALLVHGECVGRIVETEAYLAQGDPAAHAFRGHTPRTEVLFGPPGHAYVYRTRQHHCLNVAVQEVGVPGCVLVRAVEAVAGEALMRRRRGPTAARLAAGPGNLCKALGIDMRHYGAALCDERGALRIVPGGLSARTGRPQPARRGDQGEGLAAALHPDHTTRTARATLRATFYDTAQSIALWRKPCSAQRN